jgi:hypothetical protein
MAPSLLGFASIQRIKGKEDATSLAPKRGLIAAKAIKSKIGQIG